MNDVSDELLRKTNAMLGETIMSLIGVDNHRAVELNNLYIELRRVEKSRPTYDKTIGAVRVNE